MKKTLLILFAILFSGIIYSQDIVTDRPDQSESPVLMGKKKFQLETGFLYEKNENDLWTRKSLVYNSTLLRYGLLKNFQLDFSGGFGISEIAPDYFLSFGFAWRIL